MPERIAPKSGLARRAAAIAVTGALLAFALVPTPQPAAATAPAPTAQPAAADPFTFVVIPDTQNYGNKDRYGTIAQQTRWIVDQRANLNVAFVSHLGDLVGSYNYVPQWQWSSNAMKLLDDAHIPSSVVPGNHDVDNATYQVGLYDQYYPPSRYANATWTPSTARYGGYLGQNLFGPDPVDRRNLDNFSLFSAGGTDFLVLNLEWEAPQYALDWGRKVLAAYPDRTAIFVTHSFLRVSGTRSAGIQRRPDGTSQNKLWTDFVFQQCSIGLVVAGHEHAGDAGEAMRSDTNRCGEQVPQILSDYQSRANGGDGWLRYYTFSPATDTMTARTYSPKLGVFETDADSQFTLPFDLAHPEPPANQPPTAAVASPAINGRAVTVSGSGSDPDGAAPVLTWDFGDGGTATGPDASHVYDADGTYLITLTATDSAGATGTATRTVTVTAPMAPSTLVTDAFSRTVSNGWGTADTGGAWSVVGTTSKYSVASGSGVITVTTPGGSAETNLNAVSSTVTDLRADLSWNRTASAGTVYSSLLVRRVDAANDYRANITIRSDNRFQLQLARRVGGTETALATVQLSGVAFAPDTEYTVAVQAVGTVSTSLRAKLWPTGSAEPGWSASATDAASALQTPGGIGVRSYLSSSATAPITMRTDDLVATRVTP